MTTSIDAIKRIDDQLKALNKILERGSYMGAGLVVNLNVGMPDDDEEFDLRGIQLGVTGEPEALLRLLVTSLTQTRKYWLDSLNREHREIAEFLARTVV